jgi:hypothetical protein
MSISSMYDPIKQINQAIERHSIVRWAIVFPSRVKQIITLILESRSSVRWPSGLRRQTKAFPLRWNYYIWSERAGVRIPLSSLVFASGGNL